MSEEDKLISMILNYGELLYAAAESYCIEDNIKYLKIEKEAEKVLTDIINQIRGY